MIIALDPGCCCCCCWLLLLKARNRFQSLPDGNLRHPLGGLSRPVCLIVPLRSTDYPEWPFNFLSCHRVENRYRYTINTTISRTEVC
ncbi:hypothetical protein BDV27DRAFT_134414 [Aspergillus caelatus]|uniref:Uncharacterized protein n=1 Tax=Aspergillus caelatus TaxID=61420 RepID=A0A5N6ZSY4_9EURO|nr:uncharacterized protein BDV27DRAFT_134414 [Aspergillus caelatus]KAE8360518.1 hypothetical protein BDV27DRAFT_134414 [Aspergillus caelatus]